MTSPEIINISELSGSDDQPKLSVIEKEDEGTIKIQNIDTNLDINVDEPSKSVNFGPGADLLMNQVKANKQNSPKSDIKLNDLNSLNIDTNTNKNEFFNPKIANDLETETIKLNIDTPSDKPSDNHIDKLKEFNDIKLGEATRNEGGNETWDGYKKFNEIPIDPEASPPEKPKMSDEEVLRLKFSFIRKLEAMEKQGVTVSRKYTMDDKLEEMQGEYEMIKNEISKKNSVKFQAKMLMAFVSGIEFLNNRFDPFDIKLDGWGEAVNENIDEYDEVFGELHEKYGSKAKMAPELKLLFMLGGSGAMIHMTNTMFKSSMPGMDDIMKQNPELMHQFTQAAASTMGQQNPGFGNFMSNMMPPSMPSNMQSTMPPMGSPPAPSRYNQPPPTPPGRRQSSRPDVDAARNFKPQRSERREMKGPSDISELLSGIKTKSINIKEKKDDNSTISVSELKEMQKDDIQKKSRRRKKSDRSVVSLSL